MAQLITDQPTIDGVDFGNVDIYIKGEAGQERRREWRLTSPTGHIDLGAIRLSNEGRTFTLDVDSYYCSGERINAGIRVNTDDFPVSDEDAYDLTKIDLLDLNQGGKGTLYVSAEDDAPKFEILSIQLWFTADGEYQYRTLEVEE